MLTWTRTPKPQNPYAIYLILTTVAAFWFSAAFAVSGVYRFEMAGLNPLQLVLVGTSLELAVFLFEIPTGIVADLYSRKLSIIIGYLLIGVGIFLEGALPIFATILLAQAIWGIGYTFTSGALDAWLADEIGENRLPQAYLRSSQLSRLASFIGIFVGTWLASLRLNLPFLIGGGGLFLLALYLYRYMPENNFTPTERGDRTTWQSMTGTFRDGLRVIRRSPILMTMLGVSLIMGLSSEGVDRLWEAHFVGSFDLPALGALDPIYWFAIINGIVSLLSIGVAEVIRRREAASETLGDSVTWLNNRRILWILITLAFIMAVSMATFGLSPLFSVALVAYILFAVARSSAYPILSIWTNRGIDPQVRATVLSTIGQMDAFGQVAGGPPVGIVASRFGIRAGLTIVALMLTPLLALFGRALKEDSAK